MICPHCGQELAVNNAAEYNVEAYNQPVLAIALCCGKGVRLFPIRAYYAEAYTGPRAEDDWGHPLVK